jgi:vancomycin resistance protein YoaR
MRSAWRYLTAAALAGAAVGAAAVGARNLLPEDGAVASGVRVGGATVATGQSPRAAAEEQARRLLDQRVELRFDGERVLDVSLGELGATVDVDAITRRLEAIGHEGDLFARIDDALQARAGLLDVPVRTHVPVEELSARLARFKDERDAPPVASKLVLKNRTATPHAPGRYLDLYAAAAAIDRATLRQERAVDLPVLAIAPRASSDVVAGIDVSQVLAKFETRFGYLGNQAGRAQNIARAAEGMEGVVLLPGEVVSFNANVGPRSEENGFAPAPEIYKGEMREGIGGGTCQVSGTLHAAALLGGLAVVERANHSRPSGYIRMGFDATVVYPTVDLKLKNPFEFPVVIHASIDKGTLTFELLGRAKPVEVEMSTETIGVAAFKRKIEEDPFVAEGKAVLKQKGIRGYSIRKKRMIRLASGESRVEVTTDVYPPTFEIYRVRPGTDVEAILPPLAGEGAAAAAATASASASADAGSTPAGATGGASAAGPASAPRPASAPATSPASAPASAPSSGGGASSPI